jgi:SET domain-containing protein
MGLIVRSSDVHAAGVFTTSPIKRGRKVVEYTGPRITKEEGDKVYQHRDITYLFAVGNGSRVIDGHGIAAFINHSCDPNCETDEIKGKIWIIAIRDIRPGEELTYDYNLFDGEENDPAQCHCKAKHCRGSLYSECELRKRRRLAKEKEKKKAEEAA